MTNELSTIYLGAEFKQERVEGILIRSHVRRSFIEMLIFLARDKNERATDCGKFWLIHISSYSEMECNQSDKLDRNLLLLFRVDTLGLSYTEYMGGQRSCIVCSCLINKVPLEVQSKNFWSTQVMRSLYLQDNKPIKSIPTIMSVLLETSAGDIVIDLLVDYSPKLCEKWVEATQTLAC